LRRERQALEKRRKLEAEIREERRRLRELGKEESQLKKILQGTKRKLTSPKTKRYLKKSVRSAWKILFG